MNTEQLIKPISVLVAMLAAIGPVATADEVQTQIALEPLPLAVKENYYARKLSSQLLADPGYRIWGTSVIKWTDGKYHAYYARWPEKRGFHGWIRYSEIAHAVADRPEGPFRTTGTVIENRNADGWDVVNTHNPSVCVADGKICLYYISNNLGAAAKADGESMPPSEQWQNRNMKLFRDSQCIGVAIAENPEGPFIRSKTPVVKPDNRIFKNVACNPAVYYKDGRYTMIAKGDDPKKEDIFRIQLVGHADQPQGPFVFQEQPIFDKTQTEDACIWYDETARQYNCIVHVFGPTLARLVSEDSVHWREADPFTFMKKEFLMEDGSIWKPSRVERPFVLTDEKGRPQMLYLALWDAKHKLNANLAIPLKVSNSEKSGL